MNISFGISKLLLSSNCRQMVQHKMNPSFFSKWVENTMNVFKMNNLSGFQFLKQQDLIKKQDICKDSLTSEKSMFKVIQLAMERSRNIEIGEAILNVNTHQRKRSKVKREKLKQRRKKIRRLSERKREKHNY